MSLTTSRHTYSSRGRTKQPKNLHLSFHEGTDVQPIPQAHFKASGSVHTTTASSDLSETLQGTTTGSNGYDTQNQDYLHICMRQTTADARTVSLYAYNRQFGTWGRLKIPVSNAASLDAMYVHADIVSDASTTTQFVIPIHGIDRIAFISSNATGLELYAAGSTI